MSDFVIVPTNPNLATNGCLCSEMGVRNQEAPFAAFKSAKMAYGYTPIPVVCASCIREMNEKLDDFEETNAPEV